MKCRCGTRMKCTDTREMNDGNVHRRHACPDCGNKIRTVEQIYTGDGCQGVAVLNRVEIDAIKAQLVHVLTQAIQGFHPDVTPAIKPAKILWDGEVKKESLAQSSPCD